MNSRVVAALTARRTCFLGTETADFSLTSDARVRHHVIGGRVIALCNPDGTLKDFSAAPPEECSGALRTALLCEGWEAAP